jgi:linoleoyl-CoA desaturase
MTATTERPQSAALVRYLGPDAFHRDLRQRVDQYLSSLPLGRHGGWPLMAKSLLMLGWLFGSYWALVFWSATWLQAVPSAFSLALAIAAVGFNVQHDGNHKSFSKRPLLNRMSGWTLDLLGASSYMWHYQHNILHHHHTNIEGADHDIEGGPLLRFAPGQPRRWFHRFQFLYAWLLYAFLPPKWMLWDDLKAVIVGRMGVQKIPRPRGLDLVVFVAGKTLLVSWTFLIPLWQGHSIGVILVLLAFASLVAGVTLATTFQLAHLFDDSEFDKIETRPEPIERSWAEHQLATTADFAPRNRLLTFYLGGLNFQVEHHLFPTVSHLHYPALAPIVNAVCEEHGIRYRSFPSLRSALASHVRWLRTLGAPAGNDAASS